MKRHGVSSFYRLRPIEMLSSLLLLLPILLYRGSITVCHGQYVCLIDSNGLKGNITFSPQRLSTANNGNQNSSSNNDNLIRIEAYVELLEKQDNNSTNSSTTPEIVNLEWSIQSHSLDYDSPVTSSCSDDILGSQISNSVSNERLITVGQHHVWKHQDAATLTDPSQLILGRSIRVKYLPAAAPAATSDIKDIPTTNRTSTDKTKPKLRQNESKYTNLLSCCNIFDTRDVKTVQVVFTSQIAGRVIFRGNQEGITVISSDLYHIKSKLSTRYEWKILASDILDDRRHESECRYLQVLFDPNNVDERDCKRDAHHKCRMGDLTKKHGPIGIAGLGKGTKNTLIDTNLPISALEGARSLFLALFDQGGQATNKTKTIVSCAQILPFKSRNVEALINMEGVSGYVRFTQRHFSEPTYISYDIHNLEGNVKNFKIYEFPAPLRESSNTSEYCSNIGKIFNPFKVNKETISANSGVPRRKTVENFEMGNLDAKHGHLTVVESDYEDHYAGQLTDLNLPLFGRNSIVGRALLIRRNNGDPWVCSTIDYHQDSVKTAVATFYYPVVGRITFRQLADEAEAETSVLVELHNVDNSHGTGGDTYDHNWQLHLKPALADFYNWSARCDSTDEIYDPLQAAGNLNGDQYSRQCRSGPELRCRLGDLASKSGQRMTLTSELYNRSLIYYHDMFLPLTRQYSIVGRSVVIYYDQAPTQRGPRLACATIRTLHELRASVRSWNSGPSIPSSVGGTIRFRQATASSGTLVNVDLHRLEGNVENYAIHDGWSMQDKEFPCSNDSTYGIYDPYDQDNSFRLPPSAHFGPLQTTDQFKVGDLSRKHGQLAATNTGERHYIDGNLALYASQSIVGRAVILRTSATDFRWVCGNIEIDYDKRETRELVGLASFDDPKSLVAGYVRFRQLEHKDGSLSNTWIQLDLRLAKGQSSGELQISHNHNWVVYVNQVGADAYNSVDNVRCIAAGFKWNPYLAQDKLDNYRDKCTIREPLTCAMGDLGMRHGPLTLGPNHRRLFSDSNLPLVGAYSIMGRSLIVFDNRQPNVKLACANIHPDIHLSSNVVVKRNPSFTVAKFIDQIRTLLNASDWLIVPELQATKLVAEGQCVQMTIHFYGQRAHQLQIEVNNLVSFGTVRKATRHGTEKISTHFKMCRTNSEASGSLSSAAEMPQGNSVTRTALVITGPLIGVWFVWGPLNVGPTAGVQLPEQTNDKHRDGPHYRQPKSTLVSSPPTNPHEHQRDTAGHARRHRPLTAAPYEHAPTCHDKYQDGY